MTLERKGVEVISLDVRPLSTFTDFFVIATGMVDVHLKAIADHILEELKKEGIKPLHIEGYENMSWVLIDYVDVVVHLFLPNTREFYAIERLWGEAKVKHYE